MAHMTSGDVRSQDYGSMEAALRGGTADGENPAWPNTSMYLYICIYICIYTLLYYHNS